MYVFQQFPIYWLLILKVVYVNIKYVSMPFIFNLADGRNQYQQPSIMS